MSYKSVPEECPTRVSFGHISFSNEFAFGFVGSILFFLGGGQKTTTGLQILFLGGGRDNNIFWKGGVQKTTTGLQFLFLGCGRGSKYKFCRVYLTSDNKHHQ